MHYVLKFWVIVYLLQYNISMITISENDENYAIPWAGGHWSSLRKFYDRNDDLVDRYGISVS